MLRCARIGVLFMVLVGACSYFVRITLLRVELPVARDFIRPSAGVEFDAGHVTLEWWWVNPHATPPWGIYMGDIRRYLGIIELYHVNMSNAEGFANVSIPVWALAGPLGVPLFLPPLIARVRRRRRPALACDRCDYDLTGNVSGRCPECGDSLTLEE